MSDTQKATVTPATGTSWCLEAAPYEDERRAWDVVGDLSNVLL